MSASVHSVTSSTSRSNLSSQLDLPSPLEVVRFDYRRGNALGSQSGLDIAARRRQSAPSLHSPASGTAAAPTTAGGDARAPSPARSAPIKVVQWNLERGYRLEEIIEELRKIDADVLCLQELDIACMRSGTLDTVKALAKELEYCGAFVVEFEELYDDLRSVRDQGGGVHGNAIMSKFDISNVSVIEHKYQPIDWENDGHLLREPRRGSRCSLVAQVDTPLGTPLLCYSVHLEVFTGIMGRLAQFSEVLEFAQERLAEFPYQIIAGDLNTNGHGLARISPHFCCDLLRLFSLGRSEADWWNTHVFNVPYPPHTPNPKISPYFQLIPPRFVPRSHVPTITKNLRNPGFYDPWSSEDVTLSSYANLYSGKLDWLLVRGLEIMEWERRNTDLVASDHMLLLATVELPREGTPHVHQLPGSQRSGILNKEDWVARDPERRREDKAVVVAKKVRPFLTALAIGATATMLYLRYRR